MRVYIDGCSMSAGGKWLGEDYKNVRWSKLLCDKLGAEEHNFARAGGCNQRIWRNLTIENYDKKYDLAIIQLTFPSRTEYYDGQRYYSVSSYVVRKGDGTFYLKDNPLKHIKKKTHSPYWKMYYERIYHDKYGEDMERSIHTSVKCISQQKKTKLILLSCYSNTKLNYDLMVTPENYDPVSETDGHPNLDSQKIIADDIYNLL